MDASLELSIFAVATVIPLAVQTISAIVLYGRNFKSVSESKAVHLKGVQRMKAAIRGQVWFGAISTTMASIFLVVSLYYQIEELQKVFWGLIILSSSLFQIFSLPEEALSAAKALHASSSYREFWDQNKPVFQISTVPLISFVITTLVAVTLRITLPAFWPAAWAMWMALGCVLSMARSFRYLSIFDESGDRWRAYTLVTAGCIILGTSSLARDQASTRVVLLGANHVVLVIHRMWTMCGMDSALRAEQECKSSRSASSLVSSDGSCNKGEV
ncbi:hypothetical protein CEP54_014765 [Fusarium duplospermum]|uniref:Uncharacterized protein n=1 Tax=Fusarium duplospermum TaxID=1325734 RepID=A0A428NTZ5_9HYPO|nr:hypothetical protein CEP54_014765 [Fusarium duplospermum]